MVLLIAIFVPAFLLLVGALPGRFAQTTLEGINAGVVRILLSTLNNPVCQSAIHSRADFGPALAGFGLLVYAKTSPVVVVLFPAVACCSLVDDLLAEGT